MKKISITELRELKLGNYPVWVHKYQDKLYATIDKINDFNYIKIYQTEGSFMAEFVY